MKFVLGVLVACLTLGLSVTTAFAAPVIETAYVCSVVHSPESNVTTGSFGYLQIYLRTQPGCAGSAVSSPIAFSKGSTSVSSTYLYSEAALLSVWAGARDAAREGTQVKIRRETTTGQLMWIEFY